MSKPDYLIFDCFVGSGTTCAIAQKLRRRWIGCDINKGSIQTTSKRVQQIILEQIEEDTKTTQQKLTVEKLKKSVYSFGFFKVNDYDLQLLRTEAIQLAIEHLGIQRIRTDPFFDGILGKNLVKIIDFNHPLTMLDLALIQDELSRKRREESRNVTIVCLGKELAVDSFIEEYNKKHPVNKFEVIELRTDTKYGKFLIYTPDSARIDICRIAGKAVIELKDFISPSIIERLSDPEKLGNARIPDCRSMIDAILIDSAYDGKVFNVKVSDIPEKKDEFVVGKYEIEIPEKTTRIGVKVIDMLGEEVLVTNEI